MASPAAASALELVPVVAVRSLVLEAASALAAALAASSAAEGSTAARAPPIGDAVVDMSDAASVNSTRLEVELDTLDNKEEEEEVEEAAPRGGAAQTRSKPSRGDTRPRLRKTACMSHPSSSTAATPVFETDG